MDNSEEIRDIVREEMEICRAGMGPRLFFKWFSAGNLITIGTVLIMLVASWTRLSTVVEGMQVDIAENKATIFSQDGPPATNRRLALIELNDQVAFRMISENKVATAEFRKEVRESLKEITEKLDKFAERDHR